MSENEKLRLNISIRDSLLTKAHELMKLRDYDNFSGFVEQLIREEHERRHGPALFQDRPAPADKPTPEKHPVTYKKRKRSGGHLQN